MAAPSFIHLHTHSAYSLAEGAIPVKKLVKLCVEQNMAAVAVTDTMNLFGGMEFCIEAAAAGIQPIIGTQIKVGFDELELVLLVQNAAGYRSVSHILSRAYMLPEERPTPFVTWEDLEGYNDGLLCLSGGLKGAVSRYLSMNQPKDAAGVAARLKKIFGDRFYIELQRHNIADEQVIEDALIDIAYDQNIPLVATNDVYFKDPKMYEAHDALLCIAEGRYVSEEDRRKVTPNHWFKPAQDMAELFSDLPEAIENTVAIARRCSFFLAPVKPILPPFSTGDGRDEVAILQDEARKGLDWRVENYVFTPDMDDARKDAVRKQYHDRLDYELGIIIQTGFAGYFLIVSDFIRWAKSKRIPVGPGRGSGAGSVVAWSLRITDLDPLRFNLLFERFLNPDRISMPDFDIDFCQDRRDEVIAYVQERYGRDRVAQIITFGKLQARAVVRDVGRVLQMPYGQVDKISKRIPSNPANPITLQEALDGDAELKRDLYADPVSKRLIEIALQLEGLYRHASTHAAGIVIGDRPLADLLPLYRDPKSDMPVTQTNMKYIEQQSLVKFDFLGLKTMTVIQKAIDLIGQTENIQMDVLDIPLDDPKTFELLARGETVGIFQLESAGMRDLGQKMRISNFEQISALVALYRPGPMENIPQYLKCLHGEQEQDFMHPKLEPVLKDTYGVMIYQEQVMQAAQVLAGYSLGQADLLRRAMGKKIKAEMDAQRLRFVQGANEHSGIDETQANAIFDNIDKFAGYGFNKAHSAGYALISYWTAWLKANHPLPFMAATMTYDQGNTDKLAIFRQELQRMGVPLLPPDINASAHEFTIEGNAIRYSMAALKGVGIAAVQAIADERAKAGPFKDMFDVAERLEPRILNKKMMEALASAGAFDGFGLTRAAVFEQADVILRHGQNRHADAESGQMGLFGGAGDAGASARPPLKPLMEWDHIEKLRNEFDAVGFYLSAHPLDPMVDLLHGQGVLLAAEVAERLETQSKVMASMAGVLTAKQERMSKQGRKFAFLTLSDPTGAFEVMLFEDELARAREMLVPGEALCLSVEVSAQEDSVRYTARSDVQRLEQAVALKPAMCRITLNGDAVDAPLLAQTLRAEGQGAALVMLRVPIREGLAADMLATGRYKVSQSTLSALRRVTGVVDVALEAQ